MSNYVVGIVSMFENELKLFNVKAENPYEAVKKSMIEFANTDDAKQCEIDYQMSDDYPKDLEELSNIYDELSFNYIQI